MPLLAGFTRSIINDGDRIQTDFDKQPCLNAPAIKPDSPAPTQSTPDSKCNSHKHDSNRGDCTASINPPALEAPVCTQLLTQLAVLTNESIDSLRLNTILASALDRYPDRVDAALEYFQPRDRYLER